MAEKQLSIDETDENELGQLIYGLEGEHGYVIVTGEGKARLTARYMGEDDEPSAEGRAELDRAVKVVRPRHAAERTLAQALEEEEICRAMVRDAKGNCEHQFTMSRSCGVKVCDFCKEHQGLARCFCGWSADGGDGRRQLEEMGETIEEDGY